MATLVADGRIDHTSIAASTETNPFNYQEFAESKSVVLDVRCRDTAGRLLNIEMQISAHVGLLSRLVYSASSTYCEQLAKGDSYASASPEISICPLNQKIFLDADQEHHHFKMIDTLSGRELENAIEVHTVELTKYNLSEDTISVATKLEQWAFLLLRAQDYDFKRLKELFLGDEFHQAIETIQAISEIDVAQCDLGSSVTVSHWPRSCCSKFARDTVLETKCDRPTQWFASCHVVRAK